MSGGKLSNGGDIAFVRVFDVGDRRRRRKRDYRGEVLVTNEASTAAAMTGDGLERRQLSLKGFSVEALVLNGRSTPAAIADDRTP